MKAVIVLFPHQLFQAHPILESGLPVYLLEEHLFFRQYAFHKQKIAFHRASMRQYGDYLKQKNTEVHYIDATDERSDVRKLIPSLSEKGVEELRGIDPCDDWLERRMLAATAETGMALELADSPAWLNSREDLKGFFKPTKKKFFQTSFYKSERERLDILIDADGGPAGGKWTFDTDNRKKYPKKKTPPKVAFPEADNAYEEACAYVEAHFPDNPGSLGAQPLYPTSFEGAEQWLQDFLRERFVEFGPYEDAIVAKESILNHSVISPLINVGLLTPAGVLEAALAHTKDEDIPLNSLEGFVRQVMGWREFIRGVYIAKGREERNRNFWNFQRKMPAAFYDGSTGIPPIDLTIQKLLSSGYCHHIERLMVLGNFMLLCEIDPDEVYRWFMELFIDAYDWVMVPNVYGMGQFADGGLMSTKPYISGSNYLLKMSDYEKGDWQEVWDALFWRFMHVHRDFFLGNPRLGMLVSNFDKMDADKRQSLLERADGFLADLDKALAEA